MNMLNQPQVRFIAGVLCAFMPTSTVITGHMGMFAFNLLVDSAHFNHLIRSGKSAEIEKPQSQVFTVMSIAFFLYQSYLNALGKGHMKVSLFNLYGHIILTVGHSLFCSRSLYELATRHQAQPRQQPPAANVQPAMAPR